MAGRALLDEHFAAAVGYAADVRIIDEVEVREHVGHLLTGERDAGDPAARELGRHAPAVVPHHPGDCRDRADELAAAREVRTAVAAGARDRVAPDAFLRG